MPVCFFAIGCQHSTLNRLFGCVFLVWRHHLQKVNKSSMHSFQRFFLQFSYGLMFRNIQIDLIILKTYNQQFTLTTKKSLHIIFNKPVTVKLEPPYVLRRYDRNVVDELMTGRQCAIRYCGAVAFRHQLIITKFILDAVMHIEPVEIGIQWLCQTTVELAGATAAFNTYCSLLMTDFEYLGKSGRHREIFVNFHRIRLGVHHWMTWTSVQLVVCRCVYVQWYRCCMLPHRDQRVIAAWCW